MRTSILAAVIWAALLSLSPLASAKPAATPQLSRADFNRLAVRAGLPLYWVADRDGDKRLAPGELAAVGLGAKLRGYVSGKAGSAKFGPRWKRAYAKLVEMRRREAVARELDGGRPSLVVSDFRKARKAKRALVRHVVAASRAIDKLYLRQTGAARFAPALRRADAPSRALFARNNGPWCKTAKMRHDPFCNALPSLPRQRRSESYPVALAQDAAFCKRLAASPQRKSLLDPFTVVRQRKGKLVAVPLNKAWRREMRAVARELDRAAAAARKLSGEAAFARYLAAAAKSFRSNDWAGADEAWAAMNAHNSAFYLRIAPDEVYQDPCQQKAGFHVSFALIDKASLAWQRKLGPLRDAMEAALARRIGAPYKARKVAFHMPDFINIILNAGNSRHPLGATIGQSLPNWGKVATESRGRTVVMTNLYRDADSARISRLKAAALFDKRTLTWYSDDTQPSLLNTILHEAAHNFGPHSAFRVRGKSPKELFGGGLASTLEELKAQTAGLWFLAFLRAKGKISWSDLKRSYLKAVLWAMSHAARGMRTASGNVRPYSQLAALQLGVLREAGALRFSGKRFRLDFIKMMRAIDDLTRRVGQLKARGDVSKAKAFIVRYTSAAALAKIHISRVKREMLRYPKATFRYTVRY